MQNKRNGDNKRFLLSRPSQERLEKLAKIDPVVRAVMAVGGNILCLDKLEAK